MTNQTQTTETTPSIHLTSEYGTAARTLDEMFRVATDMENHAESLDWENEGANRYAQMAWTAYEGARDRARERVRRNLEAARTIVVYELEVAA